MSWCYLSLCGVSYYNSVKLLHLFKVCHLLSLNFQVNKIVEQLISFVQYYDLQGIREYWSYLRRRFFSRLDSMHLHNAHKLEKCLYRFYLVNAVQTSRSDKVTEFFEKMAPELQNQADWKEWFGNNDNNYA